MTECHADTRTQHFDQAYLPILAEPVQLVGDPHKLLFGGIIGCQRLTRHNVAFHVGDLLRRTDETAFRQIRTLLCFIAAPTSPQSSDVAVLSARPIIILTMQTAVRRPFG